ncbi:MAG TPA: GIDE domain-containing protein [Terriglobales bacterium]|nr:GIDE domain-containing protein [Terriglobales bacterium]
MLAIIFKTTSSTPWLWPLLGTGAGVYLFIHGFQLLRRKRLIMNTPASKIRSAAMGLIEVSGLATGPYTMQAPLTGLACYYYRTLAWQWKREGKNSQWVKVADESMHVPFFLDDNTGRMLVDPQGAEMEIHRDFQDELSQSFFSSQLEIPANVTGFLVRHGVPTDCKLKLEEYCIKPKNALFVLGTLAENNGLTVTATPVPSLPAGKHSLSFSTPISLSVNSMSIEASGSSTFSTCKNELRQNPVQSSGSSIPSRQLDPAQQEKIAAVLRKAGITSPTAWAAAGLGSAVQVTTASSAAAAAAPAKEQFDLHPPVVLMKGAHNPAFFISWRSQREVVKSLGWKSALMIWGGPALTLLCVYILLSQYGGL